MSHTSNDSVGIIYDLGANSGDNLPYFLSRADIVVAVEANPALVDVIQQKYGRAIALGRLRVVHCALADVTSDLIPFFISKSDSHVSALAPAVNRHSSGFERIEVPAMRIVDLITEHGYPAYVKSDLEGHDPIVLRQLFDAGVYPDYVSAEAHTLMPFSLMEDSGRYNSYQIMNARTFHRLPLQCVDQQITGFDVFQFHEGTSGPFGKDIPSPWMNANQCLLNLGIAGLGWRDVHARKQSPDSNSRVYLENIPLRSLAGAIARKVIPPSWIHANNYM